MKKQKLFILITLLALLLNMVSIQGSSLLNLSGKTKSFTDVPTSHWANPYIESLAGEGIINGVSQSQFKPDNPITRSEFTKLAVLIMDFEADSNLDNPFTDIQTSDWYYEYVIKGYQYTLVKGKTTTEFKPQDNITREEVFTILSRMISQYCLDSDEQPIIDQTFLTAPVFKDSENISSYAKAPITLLEYYKVINGYEDNTIHPKTLMTRAEAAAVIYKVATTFTKNPNISSDAIESETTESQNVEPETAESQTKEPDSTNLITTADLTFSMPESFQYKLKESVKGLNIWTDYPSERIFKDSEIPESTDSGIYINLAKNEFEPFQIILNPQTQIDISVTTSELANGLDVEFHQVEYVNLSETTDQLGRLGDYPDPLYPKELGSTLSLQGNENTSLWFTLHTDHSINAGNYSFFVYINDISIPVYIHVFDFSIPQELHVKSQINVSTNRVLEKYGVSGTGENYWKYVESFKQFFIDHRLTPKSALWSGGLTSNGGSPYIDYNASTGQFSDPHGIWGFEFPASRYIAGESNTINQYLPADRFNNGYGFPSFMAITFRNNDASADQRPGTFEGITRNDSDWYQSNNPDSVYNQKWFDYISDIESYLTETGYLDEAYYYFANEPQNTEDYNAVSWYANQLKAAAPNLKLMVSEEPKPEIYDNPLYPGAKIDQWLPVLNNYDPTISWDREFNHDEETWIYFLYGTKPPYYNPITLDHPGIESKLTGWFLWKYRIKGIAHYSFNNWSKNVWTETMTSGHNGDDFMLYPPSKDNTPVEYGATNHRFVSSIRFELMRDSLEDYEYLYVLNNNQSPEVYQANTADAEADKIIYGLTSYNRDSHSMYLLRSYIGSYLEGSLNSIPDIQASDLHERTSENKNSYYINFQDPTASPSTSPLILNEKEYIKIGWNDYDSDLGYGWYGDMSHVMYQYLDNGPDPLKSSILYDDWGREKTFEFDLPNGDYQVTVCCGWDNRTYNRNQIVIEGITFIDDEATAPYLVRTMDVQVKDNKLTMEMGIFDEYTMLNYMEIVAK